MQEKNWKLGETRKYLRKAQDNKKKLEQRLGDALVKSFGEEVTFFLITFLTFFPSRNFRAPSTRVLSTIALFHLPLHWSHSFILQHSRRSNFPFPPPDHWRKLRESPMTAHPSTVANVKPSLHRLLHTTADMSRLSSSPPRQTARPPPLTAARPKTQQCVHFVLVIVVLIWSHLPSIKSKNYMAVSTLK